MAGDFKCRDLAPDTAQKRSLVRRCCAQRDAHLLIKGVGPVFWRWARGNRLTRVLPAAVERRLVQVIEELERHQKAINTAGVLAVVIAVARTALLAVPEPLPWFSEAGELVYDLAIAFATAWLFQLAVVAVPATAQRRRFEEIVARRVDRLIELGFQLSTAIALAGGSRGDAFPVVPEAIRAHCRSIAPTGEVPGWLHADWLGLVRHLGELSGRERASLKPFYPRMSEDLIALLEREEGAMLTLETVERLLRATEPSDMRQFEKGFVQWLHAIHELLNHRKHRLAPHVAVPEAHVDSNRIPVILDRHIEVLADLRRHAEGA